MKSFKCLHVLLGVLAALFLMVGGVNAEAPKNSDCLMCHQPAEKPADVKSLADWKGLQPAVFEKSVHGKMDCVMCHSAISAVPHDMKLPPADCSTCHGNVIESLKKGAHGGDAAKAGNVTCASCHGNAHEIVHGTDIKSPVNKFNQTTTCAQCHNDPEKAKTMGIKDAHAVSQFSDSIHGRALKAGLGVAPACSDCHGSHEIKANSVDKVKINEQCSTCHKAAKTDLMSSIHGQSVSKQNPRAPLCTDCHSAHSISEPGTVAFKKTNDANCGACHQKEQEHYRETFHGKAMFLNQPGQSAKVAACYDCHGSHNIFPVTDPRSKLSDKNRIATCAECHPGSNKNFANFIAHADHTDSSKNPILYYAYIFMTALVIGVFAIFGIHTLLWALRILMMRIRNPQAWKEARHAAHADKVTIRRFTPYQRFQHILMAGSFLGLSFTGLPQKFYDAPWAQSMIDFMGGPLAATKLHHIAALVMILSFLMHCVEMATLGWKRRAYIRNPETGKVEIMRFLRVLFGPDSLMPRWQDGKDIVAHIKWFFNCGPRPQFDRWTYWEKFDYLAVFWGMFIIGLSGLVLWFPIFFAKFLPGWMLNLATLVHSDEALLATGFIFAVHFFNTHFRPDRFPMDTVIFSGYITKEEMLQERRQWYDRLVATGRLEQMREVFSDFESRKWLFKTLGFLMLFTGLGLLALIIYAFISRLM